MVVGVDAAGGVVLTVPVVGVTGCYVIGRIVVVADCQVQSVGTGTVFGVGVVICVCTSLGIGAVVP